MAKGRKMGNKGNWGLFFKKIWETRFLLITSPRRSRGCRLATIRGGFKALQKIMIIGVDAGVLGVSDDRLKVGVYHFVYNLLKELSVIDKDNQYLLYSFFPIGKDILSQFGKNFRNIILRPQKGWLSIRLSAQFLFHKHDLFLGLSQALPFYHPMKSIVYIYDLAFELYPEHYRDSYRRLSLQTKFAANQSDKIVAVSKATKNDLMRLYNIDGEKIEVIYHSVDDRFKSSPIKEKGKIPYFLFVGSFKPSKNIPNIIRAFSLFIKESKKPYQLILAGSNYWGDNDVAKQIKDLNLENKVKRIGFVSEDDLPQLYRGATAFVSPSFYEGFGIPHLEAMACGVPVITSNCGSIPEIVGNGALMADPENANEIKEAMMSIVTDDDLRSQLIQKGLSQARKFSGDKSGRELLKLLQ